MTLYLHEEISRKLQRVPNIVSAGCYNTGLIISMRFPMYNHYCESQTIEIKELELTLVNIYRPPKTPRQLFYETLERTQKIIDETVDNENSKSKTILALGDYNFPFIKWPNKRIYYRDEEPNQMDSEKAQGKMLIEWAEKNFLEQYINSPTRKDNVLDLVFTNLSSLINGYTTIVNQQFSDHNILKLNLNIMYKKEPKKKRINPYPNKISEYDLMKGKLEDWIRYDVLVSKLAENFDIETKDENTEERLKRFYDIIEKAVITLFEKKESFKNKEERKQTPRNKIPKKMRNLMKKKTNISNKIMLSNSGLKTLKLMKHLYKIESELNNSYKQSRIKKETEAIDKMKSNPKFFFSYASKFSKSKNKIGPLIDAEGETIKDPHEMAEILRKQYESTFSTPDPEFEEETEVGDNKSTESNNENETQESEVETEVEDEEGNNERTEPNNDINKPQLTDIHFDYEDIIDAIDQLALCSGPGPDGISAILLKKSKVTISLMLNNIFQHSMKCGEIPEILKLGFICPILKPESRRETPSSWRPVNLTSHVIKSFERVLRKKIVAHLEYNNLMDQRQHGSRQGRSCLSQLLEHYDEILRMLETGENVDVIYTDFAKAYEKTCHSKMLLKMKNYAGIQGTLLKWIQNFLTNRKQQVLIEGEKSQESKVLSGSIQGSVLGPVFFLIYLLDMNKDISADIKIFVDDTKIKDKVKEENDVEKLQDDVEKLYNWQANNNMEFNDSKFQLLRYGHNENLKNETLYFTGNMDQVIMRVSFLRDLGVIMSDNARFEDHIDHVTKKVRQRVGWIFRTFYSRNTEVMKHIWKTLVQCHIDFCSQLYKPSSAQGMLSIEKLFYDFTSKLPAVQSLNYWSRLKYLNMYSQERRMERYRVIYIWKNLEGLVPNSGVVCANMNERQGRKVKVPSLQAGGRQAIQTLREASFQIDGARLFNKLPQKIREIKTHIDDFKFELDKYLSNIPDQPKMNDLVPAAVCRVTVRQSNSLLAWIQET